MSELVTRHLGSVIAERLREAPVVVLAGARAVGKSTVMAHCARLHGVNVVDLENLDMRRLVNTDPTLFVGADRPRPVCIDEFQHELFLLDAIKAELNRQLKPGRYLLAGSTRYAMLPDTSQSLTGPAHVITMWPLSQGELIGHRETALDQLITDPTTLVAGNRSTTRQADYEQLILAGGYPSALVKKPEARSRWLQNYVNLVVQRDMAEMTKMRVRQTAPQVLRLLAEQTSQVLNVAAIANAMHTNPHSANHLIGLLESIFLVHRLEAFGTTLGARVAKSPKVHLVDSGLAAHLLRITEAKLSGLQPAVLTQFGQVLKTFTVNELIKQSGWASEMVEFSHFRTRDGDEVDLVIEARDGRVAGVKVAASSIISDQDFRGLRILRDRLRDEFVGGVLINLGEYSATYDDRLHVLPLDRLWTG